MKILNKIILPLITVFIILISVWLITVIITCNRHYYDWQFEKNETLESLSWVTDTGEYITYTEEDLQKVKNQIIDYLFDKKESMQVIINGHDFFSTQALNHMSDVKKLYRNWTILTIILIILLLPCLYYFIKNYKELKTKLFTVVWKTYIVIGALLLIIMIFMLVDFNWTFTNFHHILFPNPASFEDAFFSRYSNYPIDNTNPYINNLLLVEVLSIEVFLDAAWFIVSFILIVMTSWFVYALKIRNKNKKRETH